ncbi:glucoamylase [Cristinia sonorae]|uniref:glucan 1,4-alpha-glucosidase n=1 Tax=Cristinia sonorae TaxID=1940300 RepID=A0A8K0UEI9_9AGAR|nr:glucoamylase [Cristinia sonorae]
MRLSAAFVFLGLVVNAFSQSVDSYVNTEGPIAKAGLLANIGPNGSKAHGAKAGIVIASPSTSNPNYLYTWVRDSSLVFKVLIDQFTSGADTSLRPLIDDFLTAEARLQQTSNPSGTVTSGGLGEPKFNIDGTAFTDPWGRPQRDGPALRATALIAYANWLRANGNTTFVSNTLWPIIKLDLDYVADTWSQSTFDLWEEIDSDSFFTTAVQHRSLREGSILANALGQSSNDYDAEAGNALCFLQTYWNTKYIVSNTGGGRSGIDSNSVLASIHTFDVNAGCDATTFQPCSDKALANLKVYVDSFRSIYGINNGIAPNAAVATGRYPEDVYFGGHPWYLSTFAVAEQLYDALIVWNKQGSLTVTSISLPFFQQFSSDIAPGTYAAGSSQFNSLTSAIRNFADGFIAVNAKYTPSNGALDEQYDRNTGKPTSAVDLTWSYASALTVFSARKGVASPSWGGAGVKVPSTCATTVPVTFNVQATTQLGEDIFLVGSVPALQNWSTDKALLLSAANYPTWSITVNLPANSAVQYKFIRKFNGQVTWESDPNRQVNVPASGTFTENDTWR